MTILAEIALLLLAIPGAIISVYFTLVYYDLLQPDTAFLPNFCSMEKGTCTTVLGTQQGSIFRIAPNAVFGLLYYLAIIGVSTAELAGFQIADTLRIIVVILSLLAVALSLYLAWSLLFRLQLPCKLCFTSHVVNIGITLVLMLA